MMNQVMPGFNNSEGACTGSPKEECGDCAACANFAITERDTGAAGPASESWE